MCVAGLVLAGLASIFKSTVSSVNSSAGLQILDQSGFVDRPSLEVILESGLDLFLLYSLLAK